MNIGKTLFAQVMEFIALVEFLQNREALPGRCGVRSLSAAEHFRVLAFAQLTWRESLRDIEASLGAIRASSMAWGFVPSSRKAPWPMPTKEEIGESGPILLQS